jgi:NADH:ubiquinone oxidoreductase subunit 5 (subunit L)/multisubunit Na+/H+ antiporter MnhA subunit
VKEAPLSMLVPMAVIAFMCVLFGVWNHLPLNALIQPVVGSRLNGHDFSGMPSNMTLVGVTIVVLIGAFLNHMFGVKTKGSALKAEDHIRYAPVVSKIYDGQEKGYLDPYNIGLKIIAAAAKVAFWCDRRIDWLYDVFALKLSAASIAEIRRLHNGNYSRYLIWCLLGLVLVTMFFMCSA